MIFGTSKLFIFGTRKQRQVTWCQS